MRLYLRNNKWTGAGRLRLQNPCKCSNRRSTSPAFHWCQVPFCGGFRLPEPACPWQICSWGGSLPPICIWITCWIPGSPCSGLTRCLLFQGASQWVNYRDKLSPQEEESSNPKSQGLLTKVPILTADCGKCNQCMLSCCLRWKMKTGKGNFWGSIISQL